NPTTVLLINGRANELFRELHHLPWGSFKFACASPSCPRRGVAPLAMRSCAGTGQRRADAPPTSLRAIAKQSSVFSWLDWIASSLALLAMTTLTLLLHPASRRSKTPPPRD